MALGKCGGANIFIRAGLPTGDHLRPYCLILFALFPRYLFVGTLLSDSGRVGIGEDQMGIISAGPY